MYDTHLRCIYRNNQLADVICQLRFPSILRIEEEAPVAFQEAVRDLFPMYTVRKDPSAPKLSGSPGNFSVENIPATTNHQFSSEDGVWRINLTDNFVSLSCSRYLRWEEFAARLDKPLASFIQIYQPAMFSRIGLRYMNFISRKNLNLEGTPFCDLFQPPYLGVLSQGLIPETAANRSTVDAEFLHPSGCHVKLHAGPGMVRQNGKEDKETKYIFDQDLYLNRNQPIQSVAGAIQLLHDQAFPLFRNAITDLLHNAMQPE